MKTCKLPGRLQLVLPILALMCAPLPAQALDVGVAFGAGTLGAGAAVTFGVTDRLNARVGFGNFSEDIDFEESDIEYEGEITIGSTYALIDYHPFKGGFRVSGGLMLNNNELTGDAETTTGIEIGDDIYDVGSLSATIDFDDVAPYIGIGWGNAAGGKRGFGFSLDIGLMLQGSANVDLDASGGDVNLPGFEDDLEQEEENLEDDLDELVNVDAYPVVALGFSFTF